MKLLLATLLILSSTSYGSCKDPSLIIGGWSDHWQDEENHFNETHNSLGVSCGRVEAISFTNSYYDKGWALTYLYPLEMSKTIELGSLPSVVITNSIRVGLAYGYEDSRIIRDDYRSDSVNTVGGLWPVLQHVVTFSTRHVSMDLGLSAPLTLNFKYKF